MKENVGKLEVMAKSQAAVLRKTFTTKMKEKDDLILDMLKAFRKSNVMEPVQGFTSRNTRIGAWVALASGDTMEIGGTATDAEVQEMRAERNALRESVRELRSAMSASGGTSNAAVKMKLKEYKKEVKKLEKEKSKLLASLQAAQGGRPAVARSSDGDAKLLAIIEKLKKKVDKLEPKKGAAPSGPPPPSSAPQQPLSAPPPSSSNNSAELEALKAENSALQEKCSELKAKYDKAKADYIESSKDSLSKQEEMLSEMAKEMEKLEVSSTEKIKGLETNVSTLKKQNQALKSSSSTLTATLSSLQIKTTAIITEFASLKSQVRTQMTKDLPKIVDSSKAQITSAMRAFLGSIEDLKINYEKEVKERKRLFNLVQELRGNIRVFARCRPPSKKELSASDEMASLCVSFPADGEVTMKSEKGKVKNWEFDQVFDTSSTQDQVYKEVSPLVTSVLDGYNVCIFAYGQTGTGKTFTMMGPESNRGVNTRALYELFEVSEKRCSTIEDRITVSVLEVYNEQIKDLLAEDVGERRYTVREGPHGNYVPDLTMVNVDSLEEVIELLSLADMNRSTAKTNMNEHSSRSHLILSCYIVSTNKHSGEVSRGKVRAPDERGETKRRSPSNRSTVTVPYPFLCSPLFSRPSFT